MHHGDSVQGSRFGVTCCFASGIDSRGRIRIAQERNDLADEGKERMEEYQSPYHSEYIEERMGPGGPFGGCIGNGCRYVRSNGSTYVFSEHHGRTHLERDPSHVQHNQGEGNSST